MDRYCARHRTGFKTILNTSINVATINTSDPSSLSPGTICDKTSTGSIRQLPVFHDNCSTHLVAMKALYFDSLVRGFDMFLASLARLKLGITFRAIPFGFNAVDRLLMFS